MTLSGDAHAALSRLLFSSSWSEREQAVQDLEKVPGAEVTGAIRAALWDDNTEVVVAATRALLRRQDPESVADLLRATRLNAEEGREISRVLHFEGKQAQWMVEPCERLLRDCGDPLLRKDAAEVLGVPLASYASGSVLRAALDDSDPAVQATARHSLDRLLPSNRREAVGWAREMAERIVAGEFDDEPLGPFIAAQRMEQVLTGWPWLDRNFPPAVANFVWGWNSSSKEALEQIRAAARELVADRSDDGPEQDLISNITSARDSPSVQRLLELVPQFAPTFEQLMADEDGEMGAWQTMNELGRWALLHPDPAVLGSAFAAVETIYTDRHLPDGHVLAIEFFEQVCAETGDRHARQFGPATRDWFKQHCRRNRPWWRRLLGR